MNEHNIPPGGALWADAEDAEDAEAPSVIRALADAVDGTVMDVANDGTVVAVEDDIAELTGYAPNEVVGDHVSVVFEADHADRVVRAIDDLHETEDRVAEFDLALVTADGGTRACTLRLTPLDVDDAGRRALAVARCQSGGAERDRPSREREATLSRLVANLPGIVYRCHNARGWPMEFVSGDCRALTGYDAAAIERGDVSYGGDVVLPADRDELWEAVQRGLADDGSFLVTYRIETADGERRWVRERGRATYDGSGDVEALEGVIIDVTERMRQLRERERRLDQHKEYTDDVLDAIDDVFYVVDERGDLQRWNRSLCEVTGYTREEIASMHATDFFADDDAEAVMTAVEEGFETGTTNVEFDLVGKSGEGIPFEFAASRLEDPDGNRVLAGIGRDVSERVERETQLEELVAQLENSNERLEQFAYAASHDLQEPLRMVSSYLSLIDRRRASDLDEVGREYLEFAVDGADRMREMIDALLQYSRVETRGDPFEPVDLEDVVAAVRRDFGMRIRETGAELTVESLPTVEGDADQLRQVFGNLLSNALEYSGDDPPRITVSAERDGSTWQVHVSDEGIGIDPEHAERVFQVFQRLHTQDEHAGTGIGLALCRRIVERHGGSIWVESTPGEGATFTFTLPAMEGEPE